MRRTVCAAVVAGVLATAGAVVPKAAARDDGAAAVLTVTRQYGGPPVRPVAGVRTVRIRFDGRRHDVVDLVSGLECAGQRVRLRGGAGRVARGAHDLFRLPRSGRYTFAWHACSDAPVRRPRLQMTRWLVTPLTKDGPAQQVKRPTRGRVHAARVTVPRADAVRITGQNLREAILPGGERSHPDGEAYLQDGYPLTSSVWNEPASGPDLVAGQRILLTHGSVADRGGAFLASSVEVSHAVLDGPATTVVAGPDDGRDHLIEFNGTAGQAIHAVQEPGAGWFGSGGTLFGPDGYIFQRPDWWELPTTGTYRYLARSDAPTGPLALVRMRVRPIRQLTGPMPTDGTPVTFTAAVPGEWIMVPFERTQTDLRLTLTGASATPGIWTGVATQRSEVCYPPWSHPIDCGYGNQTFVDPATQSRTITWPPFAGSHGAWLVMMRFGPGQAGTVSLSVTQ